MNVLQVFCGVGLQREKACLVTLGQGSELAIRENRSGRSVRPHFEQYQIVKHAQSLKICEFPQEGIGHVVAAHCQGDAVIMKQIQIEGLSGAKIRALSIYKNP